MWLLKVDPSLNPELRAARFWQIALQQFALAYFMVGITFVLLFNGWFGWLPIPGVEVASGFWVSGVVSVLTLSAAQWAERNIKAVFWPTGVFSDLAVRQVTNEISGVLAILRILIFVLWPITFLVSCLGTLVR